MRAMIVAALVSWMAVSSTGEATANQGQPANGRFDIGGRSIRLSCKGAGGPVVVIDAGMGTVPVEDPGWRAIAAQIEPVTRIACMIEPASAKAIRRPRARAPAWMRPTTSMPPCRQLGCEAPTCWSATRWASSMLRCSGRSTRPTRRGWCSCPQPIPISLRTG